VLFAIGWGIPLVLSERFAIGWGIPLVLSERFINSVLESLVVVIIESLNLTASTDKGGRDFRVWFGCIWRHMHRVPLTGFVRVKICA